MKHDLLSKHKCLLYVISVNKKIIQNFFKFYNDLLLSY